MKIVVEVNHDKKCLYKCSLYAITKKTKGEVT